MNNEVRLIDNKEKEGKRCSWGGKGVVMGREGRGQLLVDEVVLVGRWWAISQG